MASVNVEFWVFLGELKPNHLSTIQRRTAMRSQPEDRDFFVETLVN